MARSSIYEDRKKTRKGDQSREIVGNKTTLHLRVKEKTLTVGAKW